MVIGVTVMSAVNFNQEEKVFEPGESTWVFRFFSGGRCVNW
jgi:hypothetical protein